MGRQSLRSPHPITARTSSVNAETAMYDERNMPRKASHGAMRMASERNRKASVQQSDPANSSSFNRELRVRASSPLLGRSYQSSAKYSFRPPVETPQLPDPGSSQNQNFDKYTFDTQSQRSLAFGMVEDMRGIGFPQLDQNAKTTKKKAEVTSKKKPNRLDLSLLFPKPKAAAAPLLSPQRYTNSPSPITSDFSVKTPPAKLTKPRSRGNIRASIKEASARILDGPPLPRTRTSSRRPAVDWFDVPLEKIIPLGESLEVDDDKEADTKQNDPLSTNPRPVKEPTHAKTRAPSATKAIEPPLEVSKAKTSATTSKRSSRTPSTVSHQAPRASRKNEDKHYRQPLPPSNTNRSRASLQSWQSEGDLRSAHQKSSGRLSKKKSNNTFQTLDLTKNSVLSLSSSEDEDEDETNSDADEDYGEQLIRKAAPSRGPRDSFSTNDYVEPEICHAEAVVATKGYTLTRLGRASSNVSSVSSDSRSIQRRTISSRPDSLSSLNKSSISTKMYGSSGHFDLPLIEEPGEQAEEVTNTRRPRLSSQSYSDLHSAKRRSRIIAVTRQEETLLEAMRLRNGRITPSIFQGISDAVARPETEDHELLETASATLDSPEPVQTQFDTSFLRLSAAMQIPPITAPHLAESTTSSEKDGYIPYRLVSDVEQKIDHNSISNFTASPRLSLAYSETPSSTSTMGHASPVTPTVLPNRRFSQAAPPPSYAPPPIPDDVAARRHSRRRTDSSEAIVLEESESEKLLDPHLYPLWAVKWARDQGDIAIAH